MPFFVKMSVKVTHRDDSLLKSLWSYDTYLGHLEQSDTNAVVSKCVVSIDIKSLQNRLLKVCYVPATSVCLPRLLFLLWPLTVLMKQTSQAVHAVKQSILLRCLWLHHSMKPRQPHEIEVIVHKFCKCK